MGLLVSEGVAGLPPGSPPVWNTQPLPVFVEGTASNYDVAQHVTGADSYAVSGASVALPASVSLVGSELQYSGASPDGITAGILLDAINAFGTAISGSFSIVVNVAPSFTDFPLFDWYKAVVEDVRGGVVIPASNIRFWEEQPTYPVTPTATETTLLDLEATVNVAAPGDVIFLQAGLYALQNIVFNVNGTAIAPITIAAITPGACDVSNSDFESNGNFVNIMGFRNVKFDANGQDSVYAYNMRNWIDGFEWVSDGNRNRYCYNTATGKRADDQIWNVVSPAVKIDNRVDHNHFLDHQGSDIPGGASEFGQVGQNNLGVRYYFYYDSNYHENHLNDGQGNKTVNNESEGVSFKSDRNMVVHNVYVNCNSHISIRAGAECSIWANWFIGGNANEMGILTAGGMNNLIGSLYAVDTNTNDLSGQGLLDMGGGDPGDISREEASGNECVFLTGWDIKRGIISNRTGRPTDPDGMEFHAIAIKEATNRNVVWGSDGDNPVYSASVMGPNKGPPPAAVVEAIPELELDAGVGLYRVVTTAGNCDGAADNVSVMGPMTQTLSAAGMLVDILGNQIPTSGADIGAIQSGYDLSLDPVFEIRNNSGCGYLVENVRSRMDWESGSLHGNGNQDPRLIYWDGFFMRTVVEDGSPRTITNVTSSTTPVATYTGTLLFEGAGLTFGDTNGMPEMRGRLFRVRNPTATTFDVYQDGDDDGVNPTQTTEGNTRTDTSGYGAFSGSCDAQGWKGIGGPASDISVGDDAAIVANGFTPPTNDNGAAASVNALRGTNFLSTVIYFWKDYSVDLGNVGGGHNSPRFTASMGGGQEFFYNKEELYSFSILLPSNYEHESPHGGVLSRNQLVLCDAPSETPSNNNPFEMGIEGDDGGSVDVWRFNYRPGDVNGTSITVFLGDVSEDVGLWTTFIYKVKCHATDGFVKIWKATGPYLHGTQERKMSLVLDVSGQGVGTLGGPDAEFNWTFRQYKFAWHQNGNVINSIVHWVGFDEFRWGGEDNGFGTNFADVHPFGYMEPDPNTLFDNSGLATYNEGEAYDDTLDFDWRDYDDLVTGWDWSCPANLTPATNSGVYTFTNFTPLVPFYGNRLYKLNAAWDELEPTEGVYDMSSITDNLSTLPAGFDGIMLNVRGMVAHIYAEGTTDPLFLSEWTAPTWLITKIDPGDTGVGQWTEGPKNGFEITNLRLDNADVESAYDLLIDEIVALNIDSNANLFAQIIHGVSSTRGEEWGGQSGLEPATTTRIEEIISKWTTAYGSNAKKLAWLVDFDIPPEAPALAALADGCGMRGGGGENWLLHGYTPGSTTENDFPDNPSGQVMTADGYLYIDPNWVVVNEGRHSQDQNEVYSLSRTSLSEFARSRAYRGGNLRLLQMGRNVIAISSEDYLDPRFDAWTSIQVGQPAASAPEAWCWLMSTWTRFGSDREVNNFERYLYQREDNGATTSTINQEHTKNISNNNNLTSNLWNIDSARRGASIGFSVDAAFMTGGPHAVVIKVVFVDSGTSKFVLRYATGIRTHTKTNTGNVMTATWFIDDFNANAAGFDTDFTLEGDGTTDFMFVRVIRQ